MFQVSLCPCGYKTWGGSSAVSRLRETPGHIFTWGPEFFSSPLHLPYFFCHQLIFTYHTFITLKKSLGVPGPLIARGTRAIGPWLIQHRVAGKTVIPLSMEHNLSAFSVQFEQNVLYMYSDIYISVHLRHLVNLHYIN